jgi:uncharacterized protein YndB with AHSA1/START domain
MTSEPVVGKREATITRIFDAPRDLVFKAWTDPKQMARWWGPKWFTNPVCEMDVRPGGALLIHMASPDGAVFPMKGNFQEIVPPERLVFTSNAFLDEGGDPWIESVNTVTFDDQGGKTKLTVQVVVVRADPAAAGALAGMETGWNQSFDKLAAELGAQDANGQTTGRKTQLIAEPGKQEIITRRVFDAPRELVFKAHTDPSAIPQWWGPAALKTTIEKMDVMSGGLWRFVQVAPDGNEYAFHGVYHDVASPERIVQTFEFDGEPGQVSLETATFEEHGGKTTLTYHSVFQSIEDRDAMVREGMEDGLDEGMNRLDTLLQRQAQA